MRLDYNSGTGAFVIRANRREVDVNSFMREFGFDLSAPASTKDTAVLFSHEAYAACPFIDIATPAARNVLAPLIKEIEASWAPVGTGHYEVPYGKELWPFQVADLDYARRRTHTLVGDEPGLGKTPIAIARANDMQAQRILCIVPASIRLQWATRIREWSTLKWPYSIHTILKAKHGVNPNAQWTIVSYELARTEAIGKALGKGYYDLLILDEVHLLKTVDSRRTRAVFGGGDNAIFDPLASRAKSILALSGTPLPNRPREAYTLARGLNFDSIDWLSEERFTDRFNPSLKMEKYDPVTGNTKVWTDERSGRHAELQSRLRANFMTRHLKRDVMPQLKLPVYDLIQIEEDVPIRQALAAEKLLDIDPESLEGADIAVLGDVSTVRRMMGVAMAPHVADYVKMLIDGGETKLVLFAWHTQVLDIIMAKLAQFHPLRVDGSTTSARKDRIVKAFIENPAHQVIIGNVLSLGTGTDGLQHVSNHALIAEPDWVAGNNVQCIDRLDRGGQKRTVQADIFVVPGSIAERVLASALRKLQTTTKALDQRVRL